MMTSLATISPVLFLIAAFQLKHFVCDGLLQTKAMVISKSKYGDRLGLLHAAIHGAGTLLLVFVAGFGPLIAVTLAAIDCVLHYHIDFVKESLVKQAGWTTLDARYWWAMSADQTLHQLTYVGFAAVALTVW